MARERLLIIGASGFIGSRFTEAIAGDSRFTLVCPPHDQIDIVRKESVAKILEEYKPSTIVNFAAHRNATTAETQRNDHFSSAWNTNVLGPKNLAKISAQNGTHLIHVSTDMVFSGNKANKGPHSERHAPAEDIDKISWYGWTKRQGETAIMSERVNASIVRIGNVTKPENNPSLDYISKILWLMNNGYTIFDNQIITLTHVGELIIVITKLIECRTNGIFHVASSDLATPYKLAEYLGRNIGLPQTAATRSNIDDYLNLFPNRYPKFGGLKSQFTQWKLGIKFMAWKEMVDQFIKIAI